MALPILDGNQTATTLSSVVTGGEHIVAHTVVSLGSTAISNITSAVSGSVVSISNFPATQTIAGTVTANVGNSVTVANLPQAEDNGDVIINGLQIGFTDTGSTVFRNVSDSFPLPVSVGNSVAIGSLPAISGTVTASLADQLYYSGTPVFVAAYVDSPGGSVIPVSQDANAGMPISGTVTVGNSVTIGSLPAISGTVTANNPSGALTTRFGSVTTANTAQITSAVTNTNRKYLLAQNISAGTVTIGIGFSPTTTQGIQLAAGGGLTFDAFCPTGAVYWLGAVTGAAFTILEG